MKPKSYIRKTPFNSGNEDNKYGFKCEYEVKPHDNGRFPANLLCSDDVLNDGNITGNGNGKRIGKPKGGTNYYNN